MDEKKYDQDYSEKGFWEKLASHAKSIGAVPVENALRLFYAMQLKKATPIQVAAIIFALGYLISPVDAVPDITPLIGFADDAGVLAAAVAALTCCSDSSVKSAAKSKAKEWFK